MDGLANLSGLVGVVEDCLSESHRRFLEAWFEKEMERQRKKSDALLHRVDDYATQQTACPYQLPPPSDSTLYSLNESSILD